METNGNRLSRHSSIINQNVVIVIIGIIIVNFIKKKLPALLIILMAILFLSAVYALGVVPGCRHAVPHFCSPRPFLGLQVLRSLLYMGKTQRQRNKEG